MQITICDGKSDELKHLGMLAEAASREDGPGQGVGIVLFSNEQDLLVKLAKGRISPDIVIVDLDTQGEGIEPGRRIRETGYSGPLILVSKSDDYAIPAFDVHAYNYVLKSDDDAGRLRRILKEALAEQRVARRKQLILNDLTGHHNIPIDTIMYATVRKHLCLVCIEGGQEIEFVSTLEKVEAKLAPYGFIRCHRSYVVNVAMVTKCRFGELTLVDGAKVPVGRSYYESVRDAVDILRSQVNKDSAWVYDSVAKQGLR
ncbi:MAG: LytTR family DNA-binding domain-containing protein [Atopobiaceae bacterium]|jgi:DNA-binding LytR/AlgR family response regulator|nr:LytTR family DNA-binding domain-containing protein [Atopobiaceae bacterium]